MDIKIIQTPPESLALERLIKKMSCKDFSLYVHLGFPRLTKESNLTHWPRQSWRLPENPMICWTSKKFSHLKRSCNVARKLDNGSSTWLAGIVHNHRVNLCVHRRRLTNFISWRTFVTLVPIGRFLLFSLDIFCEQRQLWSWRDLRTLQTQINNLVEWYILETCERIVDSVHQL